MRDALYRLTTPILDRIPDPSLQTPRRQVVIGLAASVLFHGLLLLLALLITAGLPQCAPLEFANAKPKLQEIELTVLPPEEETQEPARIIPLSEIFQPPPFLDSLGLAAASQAPAAPVFESDVDMIAASESPALGNLPLPSQDGRVSDFPMFTDQRVSLGMMAVPFPMDVRLATAPPAAAPPAPPREVAKPAEAAREPPPVATPAPVLAKLENKPTPFRETTMPREDEIAVATKPQATPAPRPQTMPRLRPEMPAATPVAQPRSPGYQPQQTKTRIEGSITNRGRAAVDAVATPLGRYQKAVKAAIGSRWYFYTTSRMDVIAPGSLKVSFVIDAEGKVSDIHVESNTSNASFAELCERALREAEIAPLPPDILEILPGGQLDMTFTFSFNTF